MNDVLCRCPSSHEPELSRFEVAPRSGGGWDAWGVALQRLLSRLVDGLTHCVVVSQDDHGRYLQWMIGHGRAHLEVSSNHYLGEDHRLSADDEERLRALGFREPRPPADEHGGERSDHHDEHRDKHDDEHDDEHDDARWPRNWLIDLDLDTASAVARMNALVMHLAEHLALFDPQRPITIDRFLADHPCEHCSWGTDAT